MLGGFLFFQRTSNSNLGKKLKAILVLIVHENGLERSCLKLMLNRLKEMKVHTFIYTLLGT